MVQDFINLRNYVDGVLNILGMFKNTLDACQLPESTNILFVLPITTRRDEELITSVFNFNKNNKT